MSLLAFFKTRRQRKARKRYEREKALRERQRDEKAMQRAADLGGYMGGGSGGSM